MQEHTPLVEIVAKLYPESMPKQFDRQRGIHYALATGHKFEA